jgi:hypothetical protein
MIGKDFSMAPRGWLCSVVLGGAKLDTFYVTSGTRVYKHKLKATGLRP